MTVTDRDTRRRVRGRRVQRHGAEPDRRSSERHPVDREVIPMDSRGVGRSTGSTPRTMVDLARTMDMKLEVVVLPGTDVDRAEHFYKSMGWRLDAGLMTAEDFRVVQVTPPESSASVIFGRGITSAEPGSGDALQPVVDDIEAARNELAEAGVR
jgi:hypothetical protein